ncbi:hypothetical protein [Citricoccus nitrophenolicus]|uniref:hypothetical protein n=1 Tax=Citricoccus nitrophenolicus TaxID=863575 RepID=UPI0031E5082D
MEQYMPDLGLLMNADMKSAAPLAISLRLALSMHCFTDDCCDDHADLVAITFSELADELCFDHETLSFGLWELDQDPDGPWALVDSVDDDHCFSLNPAYVATGYTDPTLDQAILTDALALALESAHEELAGVATESRPPF